MGGGDGYIMGRDVCVYVYLVGPRNFHPYRDIGWVTRETPHSVTVPMYLVLGK